MNDRTPTNPFSFWCRRITGLLIIFIAGWWLLSDTYARYYPSDQQDDLTLRFAHFGNDQDYALWRNVIKDFERSHPDIQVQQEYIVGLAGHYNTKMRQQILSHTLPDVALVQLGPFHELAHHFADLTERLQTSTNADPMLAEALDATALSAFMFKGKQRGLPISGGNLLIYCNLECFQQASKHHGRDIPLPRDGWTIEDFHRTAQLLTCDFNSDGVYDQFGFWLPRWMYYLPFLWSFGATLTDDAQQTWTFIGPEAIQAVTFYKSLITGERVCPRDDEVPQLFQDVGFLTGKTAMCVNGPWFQPFLAKTRLANQYIIAPIPVGPAGRKTRITWDAAVMADDLRPLRREVAWTFMQFLVSQSVQDRIAQTGRALPARIASLPMFIDGHDSHRRERFIEALSYSRLQPIFPRFHQIDRAINEHLYRIINSDNHLSVHAMLKQLAQDQAITDTFNGVHHRATP